MKCAKWAGKIFTLFTLLLGGLLLAACGSDPTATAVTPPTPTTVLATVPVEGANAAIFNSQAAAVVGVVVDPNLKVVAVDPNSAAQAVGIQVGDTINMINGTIITTPADAKQLLATTNTTSGVAFTLDRSGTPVTLTVTPKAPASGSSATATPIAPPLDYF